MNELERNSALLLYHPKPTADKQVEVVRLHDHNQVAVANSGLQFSLVLLLVAAVVVNKYLLLLYVECLTTVQSLARQIRCLLMLRIPVLDLEQVQFRDLQLLSFRETPLLRRPQATPLLRQPQETPLLRETLLLLLNPFMVKR